MISNGMAYAAGAGGLAVGAGAGIGMARLGSDGVSTSFTSLEGTMIAVGGLGAFGTLSAMPVAAGGSGGRLAAGLVGMGVGIGTLGAMSATTMYGLGDDTPDDGVRTRNAIAGGLLGATLGGIGTAAGMTMFDAVEAMPGERLMGTKGIVAFGVLGAAAFGAMGVSEGRSAAARSLARHDDGPAPKDEPVG